MNEEQRQKRNQMIFEAFKSGKEIVSDGELKYQVFDNFLGIVRGGLVFHQIPQYDGFICEANGVYTALSGDQVLPNALLHARRHQKNVLILDDGCLMEIHPNTSLEEARQKLDLLKAKREAFFAGMAAETKQRKEDAAEKYQELTIVNQPLWDEIVKANLLAPKTEVIVHTVSPNAQNKIDSLFLYGRILEGLRKKDGLIVPSAVEYADDIADLSLDIKKITRGLPKDWLQTRFEGERFWADIVLAKTWKYGEELLKAEGFPDEDIKRIKEDATLPLTYTYWASFSHPQMRDIRVKEFWYGESPEKVKKLTHYERRFAVPDNQKQKG